MHFCYTRLYLSFIMKSHYAKKKWKQVVQVKDFAGYSNEITLYLQKHTLYVGHSNPECCWSDCSHLLLKIKNRFSSLSRIISNLC